MLGLVLVAVNLALLRAVFGNPIPECLVLTLGVLPMVSALAGGVFVGFGRLGSRPFILGFEAAGVLALAIYVILSSVFRNEIVAPYVGLVINSVLKLIGQNRRLYRSFAYPGIAVMLAVPQLLFALLGGCFSARCMTGITRREEA